jgi:hypothetical protein
LVPSVLPLHSMWRAPQKAASGEGSARRDSKDCSPRTTWGEGAGASSLGSGRHSARELDRASVDRSPLAAQSPPSAQSSTSGLRASAGGAGPGVYKGQQRGSASSTAANSAPTSAGGDSSASAPDFHSNVFTRGASDARTAADVTRPPIAAPAVAHPRAPLPPSDPRRTAFAGTLEARQEVQVPAGSRVHPPSSAAMPHGGPVPHAQSALQQVSFLHGFPSCLVAWSAIDRVCGPT